MQEYQVRDRNRMIIFHGILLAEATSKREPFPSRWTELRLYNTVGDAYVLEKVGRSMVTHDPCCLTIRKDLPRFQSEYPGEDPDDEKFDYHDCVPDEYDFTELLVEADRYWALHTYDPVSVMNALYMQGPRIDPSRSRYTRASKMLLDATALVDAKFKKLWTVQETLLEDHR